MEEEVGLRITLRDRRAAAAGIAEVRTNVRDLGNETEAAGRKADGAASKYSKLSGALGVVGRGVKYGIGLMGALGAASVGIGIKTAASMETATIGFTTMLGSGRKAKAFLGDLSSFAAKTPFEFPELQSAASSLVSVGIETKSIIPIMTSLGNATAGMGTGSEGINRATTAIQQMIAAQKVSGEDLNQLRDAGIPVYDLLAAAMGRSKAEVAALAQEGKLGKDALDAMMGALESGKGLERFNGLMEKQSQSLSGVWSTLKDTVTMGLAGAIQPALPMIKELVVGANDLAQKAMPHLRDGVAALVGYIRQLVDAYQAGGIEGMLAALGGDAAGGASQVGSALVGIGHALGDIDWSQLGDGAMSGAVVVLNGFASVLKLVGDHADTLAKYMPALVAGFIAYKVAQKTIGKDSVVGFVAQTGATLALAASNIALAKAIRSSTIATGQSTAAGQASTAGRVRDTAATIAKTVAEKAAAGAAKAMAAAQWLVNTAMSANPIGLVVLAIAALVGIFVLAYNKVGWFRSGVQAAFSGVLGIVRGAIGWVRGNWPKLFVILTGPIGLAVLLISRNWEKIKTGASAVRNFVVGKFQSLLSFITGLPSKIGRATSGLFDGVKTAFRGAINFVIRGWNSLQFRIPEIDTHLPGVGKIGGGSFGVPQIPMLATGGPVVAGRPYIVGDGGRPELFVPKEDGYVHPRVPGPESPKAWGPSDIDAAVLSDDTDVRVGATTPGGPTTVQLVLDGKVIAETVLDQFDERSARR